MHKQNRNISAHAKNSKQSFSGFTIVELLIVTVVIAIMAAITFVSFNGITGRAREAVSMANLKNVHGQLAVFQAVNSTFPVANDCTSTPAANTVCLAAASGTSYQYIFDNAASPQTFCLTSWNGSANYYINQDNSRPTTGVCIGHVAGGATPPVTISNLSVNPALTANATSWVSAGTIASVARVSVGDLPGFAWAYSGNATASGARLCVGDGSSLLVSGDTYAVTMWVKAPAGAGIAWQTTDSAGTFYGSVTSIGTATGAWQKAQFTFVPTGATIRVCLRFTGSVSYGIIYMTGVILTSGNTSYNYADGNTSGWSWSGTSNNSTSSGPNTGL